MVTVPRKNVSKVIADVRPPLCEDKEAEERGKELESEEETRAAQATELFFEGAAGEGAPSIPPGKRVDWKKFFLLCASGFTVFILIAAAFFYYSDRVLLGYGAESFREFQTGLEGMSALRTEQAAEHFLNIQNDLDKTAAQSSLFSYAKNISTGFWPLLWEGASTINDLKDLATEGVALAREFDSLTRLFPDYALKQRGGELIASLERIQAGIGKVNSANSALAGKIAKFDPSSAGGAALPFRVELARLGDFLGPLIGWLKSEKANHLVVFLENPSEMRPGGGFIGSYADVSILKGNIENIEVHDINDPDRELAAKIIPPKPLQALVTRWRAADANWFFDFSESAAKVVGFLEESDLYKKRNIEFEGAIGLSANAIADILELTGPVEVSGVRLTSENFIQEIQSEVIAERGNKSPDPKEILKQLAPILIEKIGALDDAGKASALSSFAGWFQKRDVVVYFKNPPFQSFFDYYGWTGRSFALPQNFWGDYLAIAGANIGGAKTDIVIDQKVTFESQIELDGTIRSNISIERRHRGDKSSKWWYQATNQEYFKIYTPLAAKPLALNGADIRKITPRANYAAGGYVADATIAQIESTFRDNPDLPAIQSFKESGKNVFGFWTKVEKGKTKVVTLDYTRKLPGALTPGRTYKFVFEKQAGSSGKYLFEISAPLGYHWRENGLPIYTYESDDPDGRIVIDLTLAKN